MPTIGRDVDIHWVAESATDGPIGVTLLGDNRQAMVDAAIYLVEMALAYVQHGADDIDTSGFWRLREKIGAFWGLPSDDLAPDKNPAP